MPITWNEARQLAAHHLKPQAEQDLDDLVARFPVGTQARITSPYHDPRLWGDTVTITSHCIADLDEGPTAVVFAAHDIYGDVGWAFYPAELEPIAVQPETREEQS